MRTSSSSKLQTQRIEKRLDQTAADLKASGRPGPRPAAQFKDFQTVQARNQEGLRDLPPQIQVDPGTSSTQIENRLLLISEDVQALKIKPAAGARPRRTPSKVKPEREAAGRPRKPEGNQPPVKNRRSAGRLSPRNPTRPPRPTTKGQSTIWPSTGFTLYREQFAANPLADNALYMIGECLFQPKKIPDGRRCLRRTDRQLSRQRQDRLGLSEEGLRPGRDEEERPRPSPSSSFSSRSTPSTKKRQAGPAKNKGTPGASNERRQQPEQSHPDRAARPKPEIRVLPQRRSSRRPVHPGDQRTFLQSADATSDGQGTEWHQIVAWGKLAEFCEKYLDKGKQILVEGKLRTRSWQDRDGNKRKTTEIEAYNIVLLGGPGREGGQPRAARSDAPYRDSGHDRPRPISRATRNPARLRRGRR